MRLRGLAFALIGVCSPATAEPGEQIRRLDWLIGDWQFDDQQVNGPYRETGTRSCRYALDQRYIRCESEGNSHNGKRREYVFYFGYNERDQRFEMIGMTSSFPLQNLVKLELSEDNHTIELQGYFFTGEGLRPDNWSTIRYNGSDHYLWAIRSGQPDPETGAHPVTFEDRVTRAVR